MSHDPRPTTSSTTDDRPRLTTNDRRPKIDDLVDDRRPTSTTHLPQPTS